MSMISRLGVDGLAGLKYQTIKLQNEVDKKLSEINSLENEVDENLPLSYQPVHDNVMERNPMSKEAYIRSIPVQWYHQSYNPRDLRHTYPLVYPKFEQQSSSINGEFQDIGQWQLDREQSDRDFDRSGQDLAPYIVNQQHARCQDWSTLRQMLPSQGNRISSPIPKWGTGSHEKVCFTTHKLEHFTHQNSEMTTFIDDAHINNKKFQLF